MNKIELVNKENIPYINNQNIKNDNNLKENTHNFNFQSILSKIKSSNTINSKRNLIDNLITAIHNNPNFLQLKEIRQNLIHIYKLIQISIADNNILFILSQLSLINLFIDNLNNEKTFILFYKRILPKLFDKFYLHNDNINKSLLSLFINSIIKKVLVLNDYFDYIESITLEDDNNYKLNVLYFFYSCIKINKNLTLEDIPENIVNEIKHKNEEQKNITENNNNNNDLSLNIYEICWKITSLLNNRTNKKYLKRTTSIKAIIKSMKASKLSSSSLQDNDSFMNYTDRTNINANEDIFQTIKTNKCEFNEINKEENSNNEIIYLEGDNSLIDSHNYNKKIINKSKLENSYSHMFTNLGVSTIDPPQDSEEDNQNTFTLSNINIDNNIDSNMDNSNEGNFQKTPVFNDFDANGTLMKKCISNSDKVIEEIKPINLHDQFNINDINDFNKNNGNNNEFETINNILGKDILNCLTSQKYDLKKQGYKLLYELIKNNNNNILSNKNNIKNLIEYLNLRFKIFQENNYSIIIIIISIFNYMITNDYLSKEQIFLFLLNYYDKIYDNKLKQHIIDSINLCINKIGVHIVLEQIISKLLNNKNNKILNEYSNFFIGIINCNNNLKNLPVKEIIEFCKYLLNNQNLQIKQSGMNLLCNIYKYIGSNINIYLKDLKEPILKSIYKEFSKIKKIKISKIKKTNKSKSSKDIIHINYSKNKKNIISNLPIDISKKIDNKILKNILSEKWIDKTIAVENIIKIINEANMNILPNGLNDLFSNINNIINNSTKENVKLLFINLLSKLIESLKNNFKIFSSEIAVTLIHNLIDKNENIRNEIQLCFQKWVQFVGIDSLIIYFPPFLKNENIEIRLEILNFLLKYNSKISESIGRMIYKEISNNLLLYLQDKNISIRNKTEEVIKNSLNYISIDNYYSIIKNFKPKIAKDLFDILNKINNKDDKKISIDTIFIGKRLKRKKMIKNRLALTSRYIGNDNNCFSISRKSIFMNSEIFQELDNDSINLRDSIKTIITTNRKPSCNSCLSLSLINSTSKKVPESINENNGIKTQREVLHNSNNIDNLFLDLKKNKIKKNIITHINHHKDLDKKNKNDKNIFNVNYKNNAKKEQRFNLDKKNNFNISKTTKEEFNKIKDFSKNIFTSSFIKKIFNKDIMIEIFAYQILLKQMDQKDNFLKLYENLDIILKIIGYRLINNMNTSMIKIILEVLESLCVLLNKKSYILNEIEYNIIFYILIEKLSINSNTLKEKIINLINNYLNLCGPNKIISNIINISINQNNKVKTEMLNIIINLYKAQKLNIYSNNFITILNNFFLSTNDKFVKDKCLFLFNEIYMVQGKSLWTHLKLEETLKKIIEEKNNNYKHIHMKENKQSKKVETFRNRSYGEDTITKKYYTISCNKNKINEKVNENENDILYKTEQNFNSRINPKIQLEINNSNNNNNTGKKKFINKIKIKKMAKNRTLIEKMDILNKKRNHKSLDFNFNNNSFNNSLNNSKNNSIYWRGNSSDSNNYYKVINNNYDNDDICNNINIDHKIDNILSKEQLIKKMNDLFSDKNLAKINSIVILHEILCVKYEENKIVILNNIEQIIDIFIKIIKEIFYNNNNYLDNNSNIKFTKYIITTLCKLLSNKELITNVSYRTIYSLSELILQVLLLNEDLTEENENEINQEKTIIFKSLNSSMMRIIDNYNITSILLILIELISNYYNKNINNYNSFITSVIKCLEKKTKNFDEIISNIEIDAILLQIHLLLNKISQFLPELNPKNEMDIMIISFIKNFIKQIVHYKKELILYDYNKSVKSHFKTDKFIINWINEFLCLNKDKRVKENKNYNKINNLKTIDYKNLTHNIRKKRNGKLVTSFSNTTILKNNKVKI